MAERKLLLEREPNMRRYKDPIDPRSAHEVLLERTAARLKQQEEVELEKRATKSTSRSSRRESAGEAFLKSMARSFGSNLGRKLFRGVLGSILK